MMQNKGVEINYFKAWKGKQLAKNQLRGDPVKSFKLLPAYLYMIEQVNPGSTTHLKVNEDGFRYMRKVISVDGTYLTRKYKGVLLIATAQDGNHHRLVFIPDRHKGIINGLASVYKQARHGHCIWHLGQNIKLGPKSKVGGIALFMRAAKAYKQVEFDELYEEMKKSYPCITKYPEGSIDREKWARAYFPGSRYNIMTTNGSESINAKLVFARELPMIALLDAIQSLISSWFNNHRKAVVASTRHLTPWAETTLRSRFIESQKMEVIQMNTFEYHVTGVGHYACRRVK
ncbi:uncharacterized protein [Primulina eburnea]|uniref:uncharacterized protein n=1 Tax=Primulina eburnea TaxID=1245227 RepID=UPI003C6C9DA9